MAEKGAAQNVNLSKGKAVKVVQIGNPIVVKTSQSEFSSVVQSLTGKKRASLISDSSSSSSNKKLNMNRDCNGSPKGKEAPLPEPPNNLQMPIMREDIVSYTYQVEEDESVSHGVYSHHMFDNLDNLEDATLFQFFSPYVNDTLL